MTTGQVLPACNPWLNRLMVSLTHTELLVGVYDSSDRLCFANAAFRSAFGLGVNELPTWAELMRRNHAAGQGVRVEGSDVEHWLMATRSRRGKLPFTCYDTDMLDGRVFRMTETATPDGWIVSIAVPVETPALSELALRMDRDMARQAAITDDLTGCYNRRGILGILEQSLRQLGAASPLLTVALLDIDHFKAVNDGYGHQVGDGVLQAFVRHVQDQTRMPDVLGRSGGEEFLLILPHTSPPAAVGMLERVRATLPVSFIDHRDPVRYSFSAGVLGCVQGMSSNEVLRHVDDALYRAKRGGRARSEIEWPTGQGGAQGIDQACGPADLHPTGHGSASCM